MARPTKEQSALKDISEQATTAVEYLDLVLSWAEVEMEIAQQTFDKPRQARLARLVGDISRVLQASARIQRQADGALRGEYREIPSHPAMRVVELEGGPEQQ